MAAIYMWFVGGEMVVLTTPYPIEAVEELEFSVGFEEGFLTPVPEDDYAMTMDIVNSSYTQLRWFITDGPYDDDYQMTMDIVDSSYVQQRWFVTDGPYDDDYQMTMDLISISYINKLILADSPDESLEFSINFESSGSSMDPV